MFRYGKCQGPTLVHAPQVRIRVSHPARPDKAITCWAIVDSGAAKSSIPENIIQDLGGKFWTEPIEVSGFTGRTYHMTYQVDLRVGTCSMPGIWVIGNAERPYALIGRDILNRFILRLDGPNGKWEVESMPEMSGST